MVLLRFLPENVTLADLRRTCADLLEKLRPYGHRLMRGPSPVLRRLSVLVRKSLESVPGVSKAVVSYKEKTAVVTYDDTKTDVTALTRATTEAGYPSAPRS